MEQFITQQSPDNVLLNDGIDVSFVNESIIELKSIIPETIDFDNVFLSGIINNITEK